MQARFNMNLFGHFKCSLSFRKNSESNISSQNEEMAAHTPKKCGKIVTNSSYQHTEQLTAEGDKHTQAPGKHDSSHNHFENDTTLVERCLPNSENPDSENKRICSSLSLSQSVSVLTEAENQHPLISANGSLSINICAAADTDEEKNQEGCSHHLCNVFRQTMQLGVFVKVHKENKMKEVKLWMQEGEHDRLYWQSVGTTFMHPQHGLEIDAILLISKGKNTRHFFNSPSADCIDEDRAFSILWCEGCLSIECEDAVMCRALVEGFSLLRSQKHIVKPTLRNSQAIHGLDTAEKEDFSFPMPIMTGAVAEKLLLCFTETLLFGVDAVVHHPNKHRESRLMLSIDGLSLCWKTKRPMSVLHKTSLKDIILLKQGKKTKSFLNEKGQQAPEQHCFSIFLVGNNTLDLEAEDVVIKNALVQGFTLLLKTPEETLHRSIKQLSMSFKKL